MGTCESASESARACSQVETWTALDAQLRDRPRDEPVYMFCTGGVRCVKAGAYVTQKLGFSDVRRLEHGVVGYERWRDDAGLDADDSKFDGENFVFDKRATTPRPDTQAPASGPAPAGEV